MDDFKSNGVTKSHRKVLKKKDRPIMELFNNLMNNTGTSLTLTNVQIICILEKELDINIKKLHHLGIDIYISIIKEYLKQWPGWEEFDCITSKEEKDMEHTLEKRYRNMKFFLRQILEMAKPLIEKAINEVDVVPQNNKKQVVMELTCSRDQLNQLIQRNPKSDVSTDIFNITNRIQNRIILHEWDLTSILKLQANIYISLPCLVYQREMNHIRKHVLINQIHTKHAYKIKPQDTSLMIRVKNSENIIKTRFLKLLDRILDFFKHSPDYDLYEKVFNIIRNDICNMFISSLITNHFSKVLNKYAYYRYLYSDSVDEDKKYDLQIEETVIPRLQSKIIKLDIFDSKETPWDQMLCKDWLKLKCVYCGHEFVKFNEETVVEHYNECHQNEQDWFCTHCNTRFNVEQLVENMWHHEC